MSRLKTRPAELAIFGGSPAFGEPLHVGRPNLGDRARLLRYIEQALDQRWLTNDGPLVRELEDRLANLLRVPHCVAMCNGTIALEIAVRAADLAGEVLVPSYTFVATAHALQWQRITPVFCDVDPRTHNLDPASVEARITDRTTGIVALHCWGRPCEVERLTEVARRHRLTLMFDAAHAFGCSHGGRMVGGFGRAEIFSFHATKFFNTFEGGAVTTHDEDLARRMRLMRNFGFAGFDRVVHVGTNGKMTEIAAAMGLTGLASLDEFVEANRRNLEAYRLGVAGIPGLSLIAYDESERNNYQYVVVEVDPQAHGLTRDEVVAVLHAENVLARRYFWPGCHRMEPYRTLFPEVGRTLPRTEWLAERVVVLPTGTALSEDRIEAVCGIVRLAQQHASEVRARLGALQEVPT